jgi:hypothetical protein
LVYAKITAAPYVEINFICLLLAVKGGVDFVELL